MRAYTLTTSSSGEDTKRLNNPSITMCAGSATQLVWVRWGRGKVKTTLGETE